MGGLNNIHEFCSTLKNGDLCIWKKNVNNFFRVLEKKNDLLIK